MDAIVYGCLFGCVVRRLLELRLLLLVGTFITVPSNTVKQVTSQLSKKRVREWREQLKSSKRRLEYADNAINVSPWWSLQADSSIGAGLLLWSAQNLISFICNSRLFPEGR
jgi:hypothetical protein